jgi:4'-phosphopantetheinyl transferase
LAPGLAPRPLHFNLSHSHELGLLGVTRAREVGVDVEHLKPMDDLRAIAARFFAAAENASLLALPAAEHQGAFFRCWTRKEAFIKATGRGLAQPLDGFAVSLAADEPARFLDIAGDPDALARWTLYDLRPPAGYAGALVVEGAAGAVRVRAWSPTEVGV